MADELGLRENEGLLRLIDNLRAEAMRMRGDALAESVRAVEFERAAIVTWIRGQAERFAGHYGAHGGDIKKLADAIERGAHEGRR